MNYTEQARESAAGFLEKLVLGVEELLASDPKYKFAFAKYIGRLDKNQRCCAGFMSILAPDEVFDNGESVSTRKFPSKVFHPVQLGVPINNKVWTALTVYWTQHEIGEPELGRHAQFEEVKELWLRVAARYRSGDLDPELVEEDELIKLSN